LKGWKSGLSVNFGIFFAPGSGLRFAFPIRIWIQESQINAFRIHETEKFTAKRSTVVEPEPEPVPEPESEPQEPEHFALAKPEPEYIPVPEPDLDPKPTWNVIKKSKNQK
jgi:hypothetical protein